jgi:hypothetical protein
MFQQQNLYHGGGLFAFEEEELTQRALRRGVRGKEKTKRAR